MAYRHGHYRKGHYRKNRNGTVSWVRGTKVRGHYYSPGLGSSNGGWGSMFFHLFSQRPKNSSYGFYQGQQNYLQHSSYTEKSFSETRYQNYSPPYYQNISQQNMPYIQSGENRNKPVKNASQRSYKKSYFTAIIIVLLIATAFFVFSHTNSFSVRNLCAQGKYDDAFKKANDNEKTIVEAENAIAYFSKLFLDTNIDERSFVLLNAWYQIINKSNKIAILYIQTGEGLEIKKDNYILWIYDNSRDEWEFYTAVDDLDKDFYTISSYEQLAKSLIRLTKDNKSTILPKTSVNNINNLINKDMLDEVVLLTKLH